MQCACGCGEEFEQERGNQKFLNAAHRERARNRRRPRVRVSTDAAALLHGPTTRPETISAVGTVGKGTGMAQKAYARGKRSRMPIRTGAEIQSAEYLTTRELADLLHVSLWGLMRWRHDGDGPPWLRLGRNSIRYPRASFQTWLASLPRSWGNGERNGRRNSHPATERPSGRAAADSPGDGPVARGAG